MADQQANKIKWAPIIVCALLGLFGIGYAFILRSAGFINTEPAFFGFTCLFIFTAIIVYTLPQLQELAFGGWKMTLREAEKRLYAREQTVRELMFALADISVMDSLNAGRLGPTGEFPVALSKWREKRIAKILDLVQATPDEKTNLRRYVPIYKGIDDAHNLNVPAPQREEAAAPYFNQLIEQLRRES
jgi:hypothetical protein